MGGVALVGYMTLLEVDDRALEHGFATVKEIAHVAGGLEPYDVGSAQFRVDRLTHEVRQDTPVARARPGDVGKVEDGGSRYLSAHGAGGQVQVVVLEEDEWRLGIVFRLFHDGLGDGCVHGDVAVLPGLVYGAAD